MVIRNLVFSHFCGFWLSTDFTSEKLLGMCILEYACWLLYGWSMVIQSDLTTALSRRKIARGLATTCFSILIFSSVVAFFDTAYFPVPFGLYAFAYGLLLPISLCVVILFLYLVIKTLHLTRNVFLSSTIAVLRRITIMMLACVGAYLGILIVAALDMKPYLTNLTSANFSTDGNRMILIVWAEAKVAGCKHYEQVAVPFEQALEVTKETLHGIRPC